MDMEFSDIRPVVPAYRRQYRCRHPYCRKRRPWWASQKVRSACFKRRKNVRFLSSPNTLLRWHKVYGDDDWRSRHKIMTIATLHADIWLRYFPGRYTAIGVPVFCPDLRESRKAIYASSVYVVRPITHPQLFSLVEPVMDRIEFDRDILLRTIDIDYFRTVQSFFQKLYVEDTAFARNYMRSITPERFMQNTDPASLGVDTGSVLGDDRTGSELDASVA